MARTAVAATHRGRNRAAQKTVAAIDLAHNHDVDYSALLKSVKKSFDAHEGPLFQTDAESLYELYLGQLPDEFHQLHTCHACARFIRTYGGLVTVRDDGTLRSAMWSDKAPGIYEDAFAQLKRRVERARIVQPFLSAERIWGTPLTGDWSHPAVVPSADIVFRSSDPKVTAGMVMAARRERHGVVARALADFKSSDLDQLIRLFETDGLMQRAEKFAAPLVWLRALYDRPKGRAGENLLWRAVAVAPEGFCHPRTSVAAPLLDLVAEGASFARIKREFDSMTHGLRYQRPQAAPTAGNIKVAEELVERLGLRRSLERRFARLDDVPLDERARVWQPPEEIERPRDGDGVFAHLAPKGSRASSPIELPPQTMTWDKFSRTVLGVADAIEAYAPPQGGYCAFTTAVHEDAPPIFKWDNPVSGYVYHGGSNASRWGLRGGTWISVLAIVRHPEHWGGDAIPGSHEGLLMVLENARDQALDQGLSLFPESLRQELFAVRATIEAFSKAGRMQQDADGQLASGLMVGPNGGGFQLRALVKGAWNRYVVDRWD